MQAGLSGNLSSDKPTLRITDYFLGMYAPAWMFCKVPPKFQVIPPVVVSDVGAIERVLPLIAGLVVTFVMVAVIVPSPAMLIALIRESGLWATTATPTPNEVFIATALPQAGQNPFSLRKAMRPLETLLNALLTSDNLALIV